MNNKITIYELLGLVKDGQAPKKIKYNEHIWIYNDESSVYINEKGMEFEDYMENELIDSLNDEVEILDSEDEEKKIPEKLEAILEFNKNGNHVSKTPSNEELMFKINEIIDYLKSKGE